MIQLRGDGVASILARLTGVDDWPSGRMKVASLGGIDQGMVVCLREGWAQVMPHGGPRVMGRVSDRLAELGAAYEAQPPARAAYPEADSDLEADMLACLARAASPAAVDLLLAQPELWRGWVAGGAARERPEGITLQSIPLDRLIEPPCVVVVGRPNVGKSTLTNQLLGRAASVVADLPGTTRDWVAGLAEWSASEGADRGVVVRWLDTPGLRRTADPIERRAIELAGGVIEGADVVVAMREPQIDWPAPQALYGRQPDVWVLNKIDDAIDTPGADGASPDRALKISGLTGANVARLGRVVLDRLGLTDLVAPRLWAFSAALKSALDRGAYNELHRYVNG